jgi:hypothetical protein
MAVHEKLPKQVISEKHAALKRQEAVIEQANRYLCAIQDELNKAEQSVLKLDRALSNPVYQFITLHSFDQWRTSWADDQPGGVASTESAKKEPRTRLRDQEDAILEEIRSQELDPMALPPFRSGHPGVKADIRESLKNSPLFEGTTTFDKAWERLLKDRCIAYES